MSAKIKVGGAWKDSEIRVKVSGAWKDVEKGFIKVAGVWKVFLDAVASALPWDFTPVNGQPKATGSTTDVSSEESTGVYFLSFKSDGTKMYVGGSGFGTVFQYTLSTAWDVSTASYDSVSLDNRGQEDDILGGYFRDDGLKLYLLGSSTGSDTVAGYTLSTAWDVSTASFDGSFSVASEDANGFGLFFKDDGTKMYLSGNVNNSVFQYTLSTAWDVTTASYDSVSLDYSAEIPATPYGLFFKSDGTLLYVSSGGVIYTYELSTAWDLSTASQAFNWATYDAVDSMYSFFFKPDGLHVYTASVNSDIIVDHALAAAWDFNSFNNELDIPESTLFFIGASKDSMEFNPDGSQFFISATSSNQIIEYTLSTAWDLSTAAIGDSKDISADIPSIVFDMAFKPDGTKIFLLSAFDDEVHSYTLSTAWDITTASHDTPTLDIGPQDSSPFSMAFNSSGTSLFVGTGTEDGVLRYDLSTAWDLSTASYAAFYNIDGLVSNVSNIIFKPDGTRVFIYSGPDRVLFQFDLGSAFNFGTLQSDSIKYDLRYITGGGGINSIRFREDNGESMYVIDNDLQRIKQFNLV